MREIYNAAVLHSTATYDYETRTPEQQAQWFEDKRRAGYAVFAVHVEGELAGFATYGRFRPFDAYLYTAEHSLYIDER